MGDRWLSLNDVVFLMRACGYQLVNTSDGMMQFESEVDPAGLIVLDVRRVGIDADDLWDALVAYGISPDLISSAFAEMGLDG